MKTQLTIEESARLIELGVDEMLASEERISSSTNNRGWGGTTIMGRSIYTLTDILSILPKEIEIDGEQEDLNIVMDNSNALVGYPKFHEKHGCAFISPELIDALNKLLFWCLKNGHLKTETLRNHIE